MEIRFVSSLTPEDEAQLAAAMFVAVTRLLDHYAITYTLRIAPSEGAVLQHSSEGMLPLSAASIVATT